MNALYDSIGNNRIGTKGIRQPVREAVPEPVRIMRRALRPVRNAFLDVEVHLVNGKTAHFVQRDAVAARCLLAQVSPDRAFSSRHLTFQDNHSVTSYPTDCIERLDFLTDPLPNWFFYSQAAHLKEVPQQGASLIGDEGAAVLRHTSDAECEIELCSGKIMKVRAAVSVRQSDLRTPADMSSYLSRILYNPSIFGVGEAGMFLLNTKNVMRFVTHPPIRQTVPSARVAYWMNYNFEV